MIHNPDCQDTHENLSWLSKLKKPDTSYKLKLTYGGGMRHPRAFIIEPLSPRINTKHTFTNGAICSYPPWEEAWNWQNNTVVDFMNHVMIWLVKHTVWRQVHVWLGDEMPHDTSFLFRNINPMQQCWCGSGDSYNNCHLTEDKFRLMYRTMLLKP